MEKKSLQTAIFDRFRVASAGEAVGPVGGQFVITEDEFYVVTEDESIFVTYGEEA